MCKQRHRSIHTQCTTLPCAASGPIIRSKFQETVQVRALLPHQESHTWHHTLPRPQCSIYPFPQQPTTDLKAPLLFITRYRSQPCFFSDRLNLKSGTYAVTAVLGVRHLIRDFVWATPQSTKPWVRIVTDINKTHTPVCDFIPQTSGHALPFKLTEANL